MTPSRLPRPTRRGVVLAAVVVAGFVLARRHGARSLGAVVLPGLVALVAAFVTIQLTDQPRLTRVLPPAGQRGESGTVHLTLDAGATLATIRDRLPAGLDGESTVEGALNDSQVGYDVHYAARGEHVVGPARITVRDVLGLAKREFRVAGTDTLTVYPRISSLTPGGQTRLLAVVGGGRAPERDEFDHLREYAQGDSLRDVHWKASAKRDELVVTEYVATDVAERVVILAEADADGGDAPGPADDDAISADDDATPPSPADSMAEATASLAIALLSAGVPVTVRTPTGTVDAAVGDRDELLGHLARTTAGSVPADPDAGVHVRASEHGVRVRLGDAETTFAALRGSVDADPSTEPAENAGAPDTPTEVAP